MSKSKSKPETAPEPAVKPPKREPTALEVAAIAKARDYCLSRTQPFAFEVESVEGGDIRVEVPHSNAGGYLALQRATFGTVSPEFATMGAAQLATVMRSRHRASPTQDEINTGLAAVTGAEPQNEIEAMLAIQMASVHSVAMDLLDRVKRAERTDHLERFSTAATKMLRTYTAQVEALAKIKRGGAQKVVVEHVHVHAGGQAIVGQVTAGTGGRGRGRIENGHQPHELTGPAAVAFQTDSEMLRPDAGRDSVPVASGEGEGAVPQARRGRGKRGASR